ncbi:hypothetical protein NBRC116583_09630 [Arenicella sp. 4NH20-0111]
MLLLLKIIKTNKLETQGTFTKLVAKTQVIYEELNNAQKTDRCINHDYGNTGLGRVDYAK